jgi:hypothetical protein
MTDVGLGVGVGTVVVGVGIGVGVFVVVGMVVGGDVGTGVATMVATTPVVGIAVTPGCDVPGCEGRGVIPPPPPPPPAAVPPATAMIWGRRRTPATSRTTIAPAARAMRGIPKGPVATFEGTADRGSGRVAPQLVQNFWAKN